VPVVIYNPCFDIELYMVTAITLIDVECIVGVECTWTHNPFIVVSTQAIIDICGTLSYGYDAGSVTINITYDVNLHIFVFFCDDMGLVGTTINYTVFVWLPDYPDCSMCGGCCNGSTGVIIIVSPCVNPVIDIGIVINIDFDFSGPSIWNPPPCTVIPPICAP
jgi:hypothetical protein